jgi:hypothetical protein
MTVRHDAGGTAIAREGIDPRQLIKIVVYTLLLLNWGYYILDDWRIAQHTLNDASTWLDWTNAFAVSIDELAWFVLLFLFELETYLLSDEAFTRLRVALMHGLRIVCYVFLAHTIYAYGSAVLSVEKAQQLESGQTPCSLVGQEISYGFNYDYTVLDEINCGDLSRDNTFYLIEDGEVVTDSEGLRVEKQLVRIDLFDGIVWLLVVLCIELLVRLQNRDIIEGTAVRFLTWSKFILYGCLWFNAAFWIYRGHYVYAWDESLWIMGFVAIDMNLSDWREEIREEALEGA